MLIGTNQQMGISDAFYKGDYLTIVGQLKGLSEDLDFMNYDLVSVYSEYVDEIERGFANGDCEDVVVLLKEVVHALRYNAEQMLKRADSIEESTKNMRRNCKHIQNKKS